MKTAAIVVLVFMSCAAIGQAQAPQAAQVAPPAAANAGDGKSIESTVAAVYETISGPAGQKRDWDRFRSLFVPGARLMPIGPRPQGGFATRVLTVEEYVSRTEPIFEKESFFESEVARRVEQWGHLAHVFSTYESRHGKGEKPFMRGINSIQLMNDGQRWWVVSVLWEAERPDQPLPKKYLSSGKQ